MLTKEDIKLLRALIQSAPLSGSMENLKKAIETMEAIDKKLADMENEEE